MIKKIKIDDKRIDKRDEDLSLGLYIKGDTIEGQTLVKDDKKMEIGDNKKIKFDIQEI